MTALKTILHTTVITYSFMPMPPLPQRCLAVETFWQPTRLFICIKRHHLPASWTLITIHKVAVTLFKFLHSDCLYRFCFLIFDTLTLFIVDSETLTAIPMSFSAACSHDLRSDGFEPPCLSDLIYSQAHSTSLPTPPSLPQCITSCNTSTSRLEILSSAPAPCLQAAPLFL